MMRSRTSGCGQISDDEVGSAQFELIDKQSKGATPTTGRAGGRTSASSVAQTGGDSTYRLVAAGMSISIGGK